VYFSDGLYKIYALAPVPAKMRPFSQIRLKSGQSEILAGFSDLAGFWKKSCYLSARLAEVELRPILNFHIELLGLALY